MLGLVDFESGGDLVGGGRDKIGRFGDEFDAPTWWVGSTPFIACAVSAVSFGFSVEGGGKSSFGRFAGDSGNGASSFSFEGGRLRDGDVLAAASSV